MNGAVAFTGKDQANAFAAAKQSYFNQNRMLQHHALTDAKAFQWAWNKVFGAL